ncbi:hypothetical protein QWJ34_14675 [Saccharibacillus sp. CPCC 101409]|uniref:hypothetical protein n=1 Tax=Saccharibacillus sp. CPCC 101409 TaxID=3058041 RepID=UPI002672509C|nr:hypothetical protein [Saccharibacillus sp. CPCC 101409]MDO3411006.1 hypothetical protein [Saccharibacillus sp. CPCC 101409]
MKKMISGILAASVILGASSLASAQETAKPASLPSSPLIDSSGGSISIQADQQQSTVSKQTYEPYGPKYSGEVNGRNRTGHFYLTYETGGSLVEAYLLEYNGSSWKQVDYIYVSVTDSSANASGSYYMKNGYSYKVKLTAPGNDAAVARIQNY